MKKKRLDEVLIERGTATDKNGAFIIVTEGRVFVDGQKAVSPAQMIGAAAEVVIHEERRYVGRGAYKLAGAIKEFHIPVAGMVAADIGAATGGFCEVLLEHGAKKVYAIDTAKGKLDLKIREHPRVVVMEETNALHLEPPHPISDETVSDRNKGGQCGAGPHHVRDGKMERGTLPELVDLVTIDVSLTSLRLIFPAIKKFLKPHGLVVALFKPQYEVPKAALAHGIVKDDASREQEFNEFLNWAEAENWRIGGTMTSPIRGSEGNVEYLIYAQLNSI